MALLAEAEAVLFVEEGIQAGGIGEQLMASLCRCGGVDGTRRPPLMELLAIRDRFVPQNTLQGALAREGLDQPSVEGAARRLWQAVCAGNLAGKEGKS